jgi:uncharacterized protein (DUF1810 family)
MTFASCFVLELTHFRRSFYDNMSQPYDLERFVHAQEASLVFLDELRSGLKRSHWMWFVFPQIEGLGASSMAKRYAIRSLDEARAYLAHPVLGARLRECVRIINALPHDDARRVFGGIDAMKLRSSLTLFLRAAPEESGFAQSLDKFFGGEADALTDERIR